MIITDIFDYVPSSCAGSTLQISYDEDILDITYNEAFRLFEIVQNQEVSEAGISSIGYPAWSSYPSRGHEDLGYMDTIYPGDEPDCLRYSVWSCTHIHQVDIRSNDQDTEKGGNFNFDMPKSLQEAVRIISLSKDRILKTGAALGSKSSIQADRAGAGSIQNVSYGLTSTNTTVECLLNNFMQEVGAQYMRYLSHTLRLCKLAYNQEEIQIEAEFLTLLSGHFYKKQAWQDIEVVAKEAFELRIDVLGDTLWSMGNLASSFYGKTRYGEAEEIFDRQLKLRGAVLGSEHAHIVWSMSSLMATYGMRGPYIEAENIFLSMISFQRRTLIERHPDTIISFCNLAATCHSQGHYDEAETLLTSASALSTTKYIR
ncbi:uncharacterized protein FFUJ_09262 [Fusarium fujikuroi IMI 58289]|uniref:Kinesin light chain n=1 Tax=Gibberella fujikuroi (strain CBS 195.34 / IMI 58289 / NRRL A-6831) TaxID=1279085 RepID=S0EJW1_GIBF5|nr:uncharacterized protein FFUJ_09262 [Fusarium fujikuroi IMI 58289]CCT74152.1 uncharacterized protein FFUJ_09262 [Fusarium fujikuroi IMI 58289]